jgi:amidophosphoribosyltransferase
MDIAQMCEFIHADSLAFVSIQGLYRATGERERNDHCPQYCDACFTGDYPTTLTDLDELSEANQLELLSERVLDPHGEDADVYDASAEEVNDDAAF